MASERDRFHPHHLHRYGAMLIYDSGSIETPIHLMVTRSMIAAVVVVS